MREVDNLKEDVKELPLIFQTTESTKTFPSSSSSSKVLRGLCRERERELRLWSYTYFQSHHQLTKHNLCSCVSGKWFCKELVPASILSFPLRFSPYRQAISKKKADISHSSSWLCEESLDSQCCNTACGTLSPFVSDS